MSYKKIFPLLIINFFVFFEKNLIADQQKLKEAEKFLLKFDGKYSALYTKESLLKNFCTKGKIGKPSISGKDKRLATEIQSLIKRAEESLFRRGNKLYIKLWDNLIKKSEMTLALYKRITKAQTNSKQRAIKTRTAPQQAPNEKPKSPIPQQIINQRPATLNLEKALKDVE